MKMNETLVGERLEVLVECKLNEGGAVNPRCAGDVLEVSNGSNIRDPSKVRAMFKEGEAVLMKWDAIEECDELESESGQKLLPSLWNKHKAGAWRKFKKPLK